LNSVASILGAPFLLGFDGHRKNAPTSGLHHLHALVEIWQLLGGNPVSNPTCGISSRTHKRRPRKRALRKLSVWEKMFLFCSQQRGAAHHAQARRVPIGARSATDGLTGGSASSVLLFFKRCGGRLSLPPNPIIGFTILRARRLALAASNQKPRLARPCCAAARVIEC